MPSLTCGAMTVTAEVKRLSIVALWVATRPPPTIRMRASLMRMLIGRKSKVIYDLQIYDLLFFTDENLPVIVNFLCGQHIVSFLAHAARHVLDGLAVVKQNL